MAVWLSVAVAIVLAWWSMRALKARRRRAALRRGIGGSAHRVDRPASPTERESHAWAQPAAASVSEPATSSLHHDSRHDGGLVSFADDSHCSSDSSSGSGSSDSSSSCSSDSSSSSSSD